MREHRPTNSSASYSYFGKDADKYLTGPMCLLCSDCGRRNWHRGWPGKFSRGLHWRAQRNINRTRNWKCGRVWA